MMSSPLVIWDCVALGGVAGSTSHLSKVQHGASAAGDLQGHLSDCSCARGLLLQGSQHETFPFCSLFNIRQLPHPTLKALCLYQAYLYFST